MAVSDIFSGDSYKEEEIDKRGPTDLWIGRKVYLVTLVFYGRHKDNMALNVESYRCQEITEI